MCQGIILLGIKHCGKSTLGRMLADQLDCAFYDTDDLILEMTGRSPRQICREEGEGEFMAAEANACRHLRRLVEDLPDGQCVVATGGGVCSNREALAVLEGMGFFIFLEVPKETATRRILQEIQWEGGAMKNLPAYIEKENPGTPERVAEIFGGFYDRRSALYRQLAQISCSLNGETPAENCALLRQLLFSQSCR